MIKVARNVISLAAALSAAWACSAENTPVDIGDGQTGERLQDYAAVWEGYAEAYTFADGSDKVRISLDSLGNGTLQIGDSPALPIATDPNVAYPPGASNFASFASFSNLFPGFAYTVDTATIESARIRFTLNPWQVERDWCELQTTTYDSRSSGSGGTGGGGASGGSGGLGVGDEVPPGYWVGPDSGGYGLSRYRCTARTTANADERFWICWLGVCSCDEQGCTNYAPPSGALATRVMLDAALANGGNSLVGTLKNGVQNQNSVTVRLKRIHNH